MYQIGDVFKTISLKPFEREIKSTHWEIYTQIENEVKAFCDAYWNDSDNADVFCGIGDLELEFKIVMSDLCEMTPAKKDYCSESNDFGNALMYLGAARKLCLMSNSYRYVVDSLTEAVWCFREFKTKMGIKLGEVE